MKKSANGQKPAIQMYVNASEAIVTIVWLIPVIPKYIYLDLKTFSGRSFRACMCGCVRVFVGGELQHCFEGASGNCVPGR